MYDKALILEILNYVISWGAYETITPEILVESFDTSVMDTISQMEGLGLLSRTIYKEATVFHVTEKGIIFLKNFT